jgi:hypothetical protein
VARDGEFSWRWEDYFRVAAAMQAAEHELGVPVCSSTMAIFCFSELPVVNSQNIKLGKY